MQVRTNVHKLCLTGSEKAIAIEGSTLFNRPSYTVHNLDLTEIFICCFTYH